MLGYKTASPPAVYFGCKGLLMEKILDYGRVFLQMPRRCSFPFQVPIVNINILRVPERTAFKRQLC